MILLFTKAEFISGFLLVLAGWFYAPADKHSVTMLVCLLFGLVGAILLAHAMIKEVKRQIEEEHRNMN